MQGRIVTWKGDRGFGFIEPLSDDQGGKEIFVHVSALPGGEPPPDRALVSFDIAETPKGRKAVSVSYMSDTPRDDAPVRYGAA